ncbi:MAG TPA: flagellar motor protein MotB [Aliidongia sp.]|uniref:flagellar motor protein MotB n=1 Tax=Aliidongia sp. TaxID=1914230 RepID=UPI002DDD5678|nr:flagellar motor protein MotB [Aliidongia sp.]HEV2674083.1 flagellar motor protein MotB [Aliidongia sp.]
MMPFDGRQDQPPARPRSPGWMITFADLMSLLVSFFVLLFATTTVERRDWERVVLPISEYLTGHRLEGKGAAQVPTPGRARLDLGYAAALLDKLVTDEPALAGSEVRRQEHRLVLELPATPIAHWTDMDKPPLLDLVRLLTNFENHVAIIAHRAVNPAPGADPTRDWITALGAGNSVASALRHQGYPRPLSVTAMIDLADGGQTRIEIAIEDKAADAASPAGDHAAP